MPRRLRPQAEGERIHSLPTEPYVGLTWTEAKTMAVAEGRTLEDETGQLRARRDLMLTRVLVTLGGTGRIVSARTDGGR